MNRKILIGGAWPYANSSLHLGHLAGLISGDVLARYHRLNNDEVIYISGTDCHGTPITERAKIEKISPEEIAEKYHKEFVEVFNNMNFSYNLYTKTKDEYHKEKVKELFKKIYDNGYIFEKIDEDNYCPKCNKFVADRELKLICTNCGNETKGDQCDCGYVPTKEDLKNAICNDCDSNTITKANKNLYLDLPKLQNAVETYVEKNIKNWRKNAQNETSKYLKEGLKERAVTRNLEWGVDIPIKGFEDKKMYVWIDAVFGYVTATMKYCEKNNLDWKEWWQNKKTKMYMVHGKDNIVFHTLIFPGLLIGLNEDMHLPDSIVSTEYLNFNDQKFSKSKGIGLTILEALDLYDTETIRFHLIKNGPENRDSNFSEEDYKNTHNEITNKLGNFVNRTLNYKGLIEIPVGVMNEKAETYIKDKYKEISDYIENIEFRKATLSIIELLDYANKFYDERKPWIQYKEDIDEFNNTIYTCTVIIANISNLIEPFMPKTSQKLNTYLNIDKNIWKYIILQDKIKLEKIEPLFQRM
ncbi:MAG: methionine--tRNA ligase [Clostridium sp.]